MSRVFNATRVRVLNRGIPPVDFLNALVDFGSAASDALFAPNDRYDVYSSVAGELGPWQGPLHRKAVMLECLRVLAGFESSWNWNEGVDTTNSTSDTPCTEESGIFQVSGNSMNFDTSLRELVNAHAGASDCPSFIRAMKRDHALAVEYAARLLRITVRHNGPVLRKEINPWLSRAAVAEFETLLGA